MSEIVESGNLRFISGLANCHLPGLFSLVIAERQSAEIGMRRIFLTAPDFDMSLWNDGDFRLKPHNHRQIITLTPLFGRITNVLLRETSKGYGEYSLWKYKFASALLDGSFGLTRMWREDYSLSRVPLVSSTRMHWSAVHTVVAEPDSAWLVEEYDRAPEGDERILSLQPDLALGAEGLYVPLDEGALRSLEARITRGEGIRV